METVGQTNQVRRDGMVWGLSAHYMTLIRPEQLCHCLDFIEKYIVKMQDMPTYSCNIIRKKTKFHRISSKLTFFVGTSTLMMTDTKSWPCLIASKRGQLEACPHRPVLHPFP